MITGFNMTAAYWNQWEPEEIMYMHGIDDEQDADPHHEQDLCLCWYCLRQQLE